MVPDIDAAAWLLKSEIEYFSLDAERESLRPGLLFRAHGAESFPPGAVAFLGSGEGAATSDWVQRTEERFREIGAGLARIYTPIDFIGSDRLLQAGFNHRIEVGYFARPIHTASRHHKTFRLIADERDWALKLTIHQAGEGVPDGHEIPAEDWVAIEKRKSTTGGIQMFLVEVDGEPRATVGLMEFEFALRLKNLLVHPDHRRSGVGGEILRAARRAARERDLAGVGCFAIAGEEGEALYKGENFQPVCAQMEWTKMMVPEGTRK